jgi:hypothetical protein
LLKGKQMDWQKERHLGWQMDWHLDWQMDRQKVLLKD